MDRENNDRADELAKAGAAMTLPPPEMVRSYFFRLRGTVLLQAWMLKRWLARVAAVRDIDMRGNDDGDHGGDDHAHDGDDDSTWRDPFGSDPEDETDIPKPPESLSKRQRSPDECDDPGLFGTKSLGARPVRRKMANADDARTGAALSAAIRKRVTGKRPRSHDESPVEHPTKGKRPHVDNGERGSPEPRRRVTGKRPPAQFSRTTCDASMTARPRGADQPGEKRD